MQGNHGQPLTHSGMRPAAISGPAQGPHPHNQAAPGGSASHALSASQQAHLQDLRAQGANVAHQGVGYQVSVRYRYAREKELSAQTKEYRPSTAVASHAELLWYASKCPSRPVGVFRIPRTTSERSGMCRLYRASPTFVVWFSRSPQNAPHCLPSRTGCTLCASAGFCSSYGESLRTYSSVVYVWPCR